MIYFAIAIYAASMLLANLLVLKFGPAVTPINAFFLIGLDLALRDWLHVRLKPVQMGALILSVSLLTWLVNDAAQNIAIASAVAFCLAAVVDWYVFKTTSGTWLRRSMVSNVAGAAVDSLVFPTLAFGALMPVIVLTQFAAKSMGGAMWAWLLSRRRMV